MDEEQIKRRIVELQTEHRDLDDAIERLSQQPGVGLVTPSGGNVPAVRVEADPRKLAAYGLTIDDLRTLLNNINTSQPKGNFDGPDLDYTINDNDQIQDPNEYLSTVIAYQNGSPVRVTTWPPAATSTA